MAGIFINFTNHPSDGWDEGQRRAAEKYGEIVDIPFPDVAAAEDEEYVRALADKYADMILERQPDAVLCQGEFTLAFRVTERLLRDNVTVLAACSERRVEQLDGKKIVSFEFVRFRSYSD